MVQVPKSDLETFNGQLVNCLLFTNLTLHPNEVTDEVTLYLIEVTLLVSYLTLDNKEVTLDVTEAG